MFITRYISTLALTLGILFLAACGQSGTPASSGSSAPVKKIRIGVSVPAADHGWTAGVSWWAKEAMKLYPADQVEFIFTAANNPAKQTADVEDMMVKGIDGLVILCTESAPLTPVAEKARERGIYIVNVDRGFTKPVADLFLEGDNKAFGRKSAQYMADKLGGKGNIVILQGVPCTVNTDRVEAAMEVFKKYPDIKILASQPGNWQRDKALDVMKNFLVQFPKIDAVWAQDDDMALGVIQAIKEAHRETEMWIFPGAGMKDVVKMVMDKNPMIPADITYPPSMIATGIHLCVSVLRDGQRAKISQFMPRHLVLDVDLITPENAKDFYFPDSVY